MQIFLCDDEPEILSYLARSIQTYLPESVISAFGSGSALLAALPKKRCDILLLDIDMPEISGLDIAKYLINLSNKPLLVFVTSHDELVYDSLLYHPFGFIRKAYLEQELEKLLSDCRQELVSREKHFCFRGTLGTVRLRMSEIFYFEADGNYLKVFAKEGNYRFRDTLTSVEKALTDSGFVRVHKGFLVNQAAVNVLRTEELELTGGIRIPIGRYYMEAAKKRLMEYIMR